MDDYDEEEALYRQRRETVLVVTSGVMVVLGCLVGFTILTGGFFLYMLLVVGAGALLGLVHYFLWGRTLSENTAGEREELKATEQDEAQWEQDDPRRPRHY